MSKTIVNSSIVPKLNVHADKGDPLVVLEHKKLELPH